MNYPAIDFHLDYDDWRGFSRCIRPLGFSARGLSAEAMCDLHRGDAASAATNTRDPIDGKPLRYRLMPDGSFLLYSIGENGKDDGGDGSLTIRTWRDMPLRFAAPDALDWVWPQPATPAEIQAFYAHPRAIY